MSQTKQGIDLKPNTTELSNSPIQQAAITWTRSTFSEKKYCSFSVLPKDSKNRTNYRWQNFPMGGTSRTRQVTHQIRWSEEGITFYLEFGGEKRSWDYPGAVHFIGSELSVHMSLWLTEGKSPREPNPVIVTVNSFSFTPANPRKGE